MRFLVLNLMCSDNIGFANSLKSKFYDDIRITVRERQVSRRCENYRTVKERKRRK